MISLMRNEATREEMVNTKPVLKTSEKKVKYFAKKEIGT